MSVTQFRAQAKKDFSICDYKLKVSFPKYSHIIMCDPFSGRNNKGFVSLCYCATYIPCT